MVATFVILTERDRGFALAAVMKAKLGMQVKVSKPTRSKDDNAALHATLGAIADQLAWPPPPANNGEMHGIDHWKRVLTLSWLKELKEMPEVIVDVTGETYGILVPHTSDLSSEQCKSLTMWCTAFGNLNGVVFKEKPEPPPMEEPR